MSDLDAKPCVADLDAGRFCGGYTDPLAMMGVALDRYLPGRNAMLVNEVYVWMSITFIRRNWNSIGFARMMFKPCI